jgi:hypothetical protein
MASQVRRCGGSACKGRTIEGLPPVRRDLIDCERYVPNPLFVTRGCSQQTSRQAFSSMPPVGNSSRSGTLSSTRAESQGEAFAEGHAVETDYARMLEV